MGECSLEDLTPGERFWIWKRRKGFNREEAAEFYGVSSKMVTEWEMDRRPDIPDVRLRAQTTNGERSALFRRRAGLGVKEAAKMMGISHVTLINKEHDRSPADDVVRFWEEISDEISNTKD